MSWLDSYSAIPPPWDLSAIPPPKDLSLRLRPSPVVLPADYFDGAEQQGICGCGAWSKLDHKEQYHIFWNGGPDTNTKAEILALWSLLWVAYNLQLKTLHMYGDAKSVIDGVNGLSNFQPSALHC